MAKEKIDFSKLGWEDILKESYVKAVKKKTKPGYLTSEFGLLLAFNIVVQVVAHITPAGGMIAEVAKYLVPALSGLFYDYMRTRAKADSTPETDKLAENTIKIKEAMAELKKLEW